MSRNYELWHQHLIANLLLGTCNVPFSYFVLTDMTFSVSVLLRLLLILISLS